MAPGFSFSPGFGACTQTSTVVVLGSTAGLTTVTLPRDIAIGPGDGGGPSDFDRRSLFHRNVGARHHLRNIDDGNDAACRSAGISPG